MLIPIMVTWNVFNTKKIILIIKQYDIWLKFVFTDFLRKKIFFLTFLKSIDPDEVMECTKPIESFLSLMGCALFNLILNH